MACGHVRLPRRLRAGSGWAAPTIILSIAAKDEIA